MQLLRAGRLARLLIVAALAALAVPGVAQAHHTAVPIVALDYSNRVLTGAGPAGVRASVEDAGRKLRLTVATGHGVVVLGYAGEPFLRFGRLGVAASVHSETAKSLRLVHGGVVGGAAWMLLSRGHSFTWADARAWAPASALHGRVHLRWKLPLLADGRRVAISGELTRVARPPLWPWLVLGALPLLAAVLALRRRRWPWAVAAGSAGLAGAATLANLSGFVLGGLPVSTDRWLLFAAEVALTSVALGFLLRPRARLIAVAALAAFAVLQSLSELAVFRHGVVVSALPASAVRAAAVLALSAGLGAAGLVFVAPTPDARRWSATRSRTPYVRNSRKEQA